MKLFVHVVDGDEQSDRLQERQEPQSPRQDEQHERRLHEQPRQEREGAVGAAGAAAIAAVARAVVGVGVDGVMAEQVKAAQPSARSMREAMAEPDAERRHGVSGDADAGDAGRGQRHAPLADVIALRALPAASAATWLDRVGPYLTHGALIAITISLYGLVLRFGLSPMIIVCAVLQHRIGVLLHEYIHGIPFRMQKHNQWVLSLYDPLMCAFGLLQLFRGSHLAHHRWLNTERDPAHQSAQRTAGQGALGLLAALELPQHLQYLRDAVAGRQAFARRSRLLFGFVATVLWVAGWCAFGLGRVPLTICALSIYNAVVSSSLRGAVEHQSDHANPMFANEYRSFVPLFNINRHIHHHLDPRCPWYRLRFLGRPLPAHAFVTHWFKTYVTKRYVMMRPPRESAVCD